MGLFGSELLKTIGNDVLSGGKGGVEDGGLSANGVLLIKCEWESCTGREGGEKRKSLF